MSLIKSVGAVAERQSIGLQILLSQFDSGQHLDLKRQAKGSRRAFACSDAPKVSPTATANAKDLDNVAWGRSSCLPRPDDVLRDVPAKRWGYLTSARLFRSARSAVVVGRRGVLWLQRCFAKPRRGARLSKIPKETSAYQPSPGAMCSAGPCFV